MSLADFFESQKNKVCKINLFVQIIFLLISELPDHKKTFDQKPKAVLSYKFSKFKIGYKLN